MELGKLSSLEGGVLTIDSTASSTISASPYRSIVDDVSSLWRTLPEWKADRLGTIANEELLKITSQQKLHEGYLHSGWIFLKEIGNLSYNMNSYDSRVTILESQTSLEEDVDIKIAVVEKPGEVSLFICPESIGTVWEMDEFRELFINFLNKLALSWSKEEENLEIDSMNVESIPDWWDGFEKSKVGGIRVGDFIADHNSMPLYTSAPISVGTSKIKCNSVDSNAIVGQSIGDFIKSKSDATCNV